MIMSEFTASDDENVRQIPTVVAGVISWVLAWFAPFLSLPQNFLGVLIIGFGVYEAWKINKRQTFTVTGPFSLAPQPAGGTSPVPNIPPASYPTT
jgi:hypothetical protein